MCLLHLGLLSPKGMLDTAPIARYGYITSTGFSDSIYLPFANGVLQAGCQSARIEKYNEQAFSTRSPLDLMFKYIATMTCDG